MGLFDNYIKDPEDGFFGVSKDSKKKPQTEQTKEERVEEYISLQDKKLEEEIKKLKITNNISERKLVEKDLVTSIFGEMSQSIQNNVIDQAKRKANTWAALLGIPEKERDIEKLLADLGEEIRNGLVSDIERLMDDGVWE